MEAKRPSSATILGPQIWTNVRGFSDLRFGETPCRHFGTGNWGIRGRKGGG